MHATDFSTRDEMLQGWPIRVTTYAIAGVYHCHIDNVSPGAVFARASSVDRETAENAALTKAGERLAQTRRHDEESASNARAETRR
jgi:hypothetical protein